MPPSISTSSALCPPPALVSLPKARASFLYRLGLAAVTVAMLLLPLLYLALIGVVAWGVYLFAIHCVPAILGWNLGWGYGTLAIMFACIVTPIATGCAIVFFMIKPIFARRGRESISVVHNPTFEPAIGEFIHGICGALGAPTPWRIEFDCTNNASAGFVGGWKGFLRGRLILRLGLPLVAAITERELAGILAHEFGHFRQGAAMRLSFLIRRINDWFAFSVYGRDQWDARLAGAAESENNWVGLLGMFASIGIMVSRRILQLVMLVGHAISVFLMRQMEFDADAAEVQLAGSQAFTATTRKLVTLDMVCRMVDQQISEIWHFHRRLPDNLPILLEQRTPGLPAEAITAVEGLLREKKTHWASTHPSPGTRIARAEAMQCPGQNLADTPARDLFRGFDDLCLGATLGHYHNLGVPSPDTCLIPNKLIVSGAPNTPQVEERPAARTIPFQFDDAPAAQTAFH